MATRLKDTDVVIVGMGAAGGVAALPLAQAGLDVVGLEAGTWLTRRDFAPDEIRNNYRNWPMSVQKANNEAPTVRATAAGNAVQGGHPMMNAVGGTSLHYWAQHWRLNPWDFKVVSETRRRYGASRIPAGTTVEDWPFGYDELEPYYDKIEYEIGVSGQAGNINGARDARGNPFEGPRKREYPMPPLRWTAFHERMADAARKLGWAPFPGPAAINSRPYQNRSGCMYHGFCNTGGCHVDAKNSTAVSTIPRAQATGHLNVVTRATVTSIEVDSQGRATGVNYLIDGIDYLQPAKVVLLAGYTYENVRLLLVSKSKAYPNGLSNNHNQVGRHYFSHHQGAAVSALFPFDLGALRAAGARRGRRQLGRRQLRSFVARLHRRRQPVGDVRSPSDLGVRHEHLRVRADLGLAVESVHQAERRSVAQRIYSENHTAVRGQLSRSRSGGEGSTRPAGDPHHRRVQGERAQGRAVHPGQNGAVVSGSGRDRDSAGAERGRDGRLDACLRRHPDGRQSGDQRRESLRALARGGESRRARRIGDGHERGAQSDAYRAGAGLALGRAHHQQLEIDCQDDVG